MFLICWDCWNYTYFDADVETLRELVSKKDHFTIQDSRFDHWNYSESMLRDNLEDIVQYVIKQDAGALKWDYDKQCFVNSYLTCARCGSHRITKPHSPWSHRLLSLEDELRSNQEEYSQLRKEQRYGHHLPVLWTK